MQTRNTTATHPATLFAPKVSLPLLLKRYHGTELENLPLRLKTDIELPIQLDIKALDVYERVFSKMEDASFTLYLMWTWMKAMQKYQNLIFGISMENGMNLKLAIGDNRRCGCRATVQVD